MNLEKMKYQPVRDAETRILKCASLIGNHSKFLDIGCGDGKLAENFAHRAGFSQIYGIDNDKECIRQAEKRGINAKYIDATEKLPFEDNFFDAVLCSQVVEHLDNVDILLEEIQRVLKPGGKLMISVPNLCSLHNRIFMLFGYQPTVISPSSRFSFGNPVQKGEKLEKSVGHRHNKAFAPKAFREMLKYYGFDIKYYYGAGIYFLPKFILKLSPELGVNQIALAEKHV